MGAARLADLVLGTKTRRRTENPRSLRATAILSLVSAATTLLPCTASGQSARDIVGSYTVIAVTNVQGGKTTEHYGPNPKGVMVLDASGRYVVVLMRPGLPKFASNNRNTGTADEYKAIALGSFTHFGAYTVADGHIIFRLEHSTFPNWDGQEQKRALTINGDELRYTLSSTIGGISTVAWRRAR